MRKRSELLFSFLLVPIDVGALLSAFVAAYIVRVHFQHKPLAHPIGGLAFLKLAILVMPVWILIFALSGLYNQSNLRGRLQEVGKILVGVSGGVMFMILLDFLSRQPIFPSKAVPVYAYGFGLLFVAVSRLIVRIVQRGMFRYGIGVHNILMIGSGDIAVRLLRDLKSSVSGYRVLGVIDSAPGAKRRVGSDVPVYGGFTQAMSALTGVHLDGFMQADSALEGEEILSAVAYATNHHLSYQFVPNQFGLYAVNSTITALAGIPVVEIRLTPLEGWGRIVKRSFDVLGALFGLIVLSPVFLMIAFIMSLTDPGPVFYRHTRLARSGQNVRVLKFRSMQWKYCTGPKRLYKTAEEAFAAMGRPDLAEEFRRDMKVADDPRVTRLGRFLRRTSLDELPQLINVLSGQMSLVGPRPILARELERYGSGAPTFLALKPGITGLWQISGRSDISYEERVKLDIYYVENWSLLMDIKIVLKTAWSVLASRGAY